MDDKDVLFLHDITKMQNSCSFMKMLLAAIFTILVLTLIILISILCWFFFGPRKPEFAISSASISSLNITGSSSITATLDMVLSITNFNHKTSISYNHLLSSILHGNHTVSESHLPAIHQSIRETTIVRSMQALMATNDVMVSMFKELVMNDHLVSFNMTISGVVRLNLKPLSWMLMNLTTKLLVTCDHIQFEFKNSSFALMQGPPKSCTSWIKGLFY
ncbi:hypothetical protein IHE45_04G046000 [Dioscorea alata]|uniref:Uncharacterized protein n=1 Tax=Dioscorea alata TaxID=55571 RepID=A0ACB7WCU0_DIOAL|nr:hypothetical protein IHE45_04G046000 [Dioscorea alata]